MRLVPHGPATQHVLDKPGVASAKVSHASAARVAVGERRNPVAMATGSDTGTGTWRSAATSSCIAWQAARAARGRAMAAWTSDLLLLRKCGVAHDRVEFAGFHGEALAESIDAAHW